MNSQISGNPLHVTLFEKGGYMSSVWLLPGVEGRFSFQTADGNTLPVQIVSEEGRWVAVAEDGGIFSICKSSRLDLHENIHTDLQYNNRLFFLYSEAVQENDNVFLPYYIAPYSRIRIGRHSDSDKTGRTPDPDICYSPNNFVSREHAELYYQDGDWYLRDPKGSSSMLGVYVNGKSVQLHKLVPGDIIVILSLRIIFGVGYIAINNANSRVMINSRNVRPMNGRCDVDFAETKRGHYGKYFDRSPRKKYPIEANPIEIEVPPPSMSANSVPFLLRMSNSMISGGRALVSGNPLGLVTSTILPFMTQGMTEKDRKEYEQLREQKYSEYLGFARNEFSNEIALEKKLLLKSYPSLTDSLLFTENRERLWERRKSDDDFLSVRLGVGSVPMMAEVKYPKRKFELEKDPLLDRMYDLVEQPKVIENAPVVVSLRDNPVTSIVGDRSEALLVARNIITRLALTHAYDELKIVILAGEGQDAEEALGFARYLPHCWNNEKSLRLYANVSSDAQQLSKHLITAWSPILPSDIKEAKAADSTGPAYLVIAADKYLYDSMEIIQKAVALDNYFGISILTVFDSAPKECSKLINMGTVGVINDFADHSARSITFHADRLNESETIAFRKGISELYGTRLSLGAAQYTLPKSVSFLEMLGVGKVEYLQPLQRWTENNPIKSLAAPIGIGTDGKLMMLDLHEKKQGPHGLIAGGTGSGKSEFIITYILSMAVNFSPDEVAFVLIDYKGGGLADAFVDKKRGIHLPHVVATITNLDGAAIQRSLLSIESELKRRQEVFKKAKSETGEGTMDIYDYQRLFRAHTVKEPLPHLFIIADEFAELKSKEPEFMDELISIARIGRSLGVHLILATQKPSGVVNDQIWSNTKFRVCLRVATKADSMEMLKRGEAAEIRNVGRYYLQVGYNEYFALGQSGWCGADYIPSEVVQEKKDTSVQFVDNVGQVILESKPKPKETRKSEGKQIVSIVRYLSDLAKRENIPIRSLWKEPLPKAIDYASLSFAENENLNDGSMKALMGMVDDPEKQSQYPFVLDIMKYHHTLVVGPSGSGKSTYIKTLLFSLISRYSPAEFAYYIVDLSGGALRALSKAPHCGAYVTENEGQDIHRLLSLLKDLVAERKKIFAEAEVSNFEAYRRIAPMTTALFVIDNFGALQSMPQGPVLYSEMGSYMKDCAAYGIKFIVTANHLNEVHSKTRQEVDYRIAFMGKDRYDYSDILDKKCNMGAPLLPGRGITFINDRPLEIHIATNYPGLGEAERISAFKKDIEAIGKRFSEACGIPVLPSPQKGETYEEFIRGFAKDRIPLGYSLKDMKKVAVPFRQFGCLSLFFGNPFGVPFVLSNLIAAADFNGMNIVFVKKAVDSVIDRQDFQERVSGFHGKIAVVESNAEGYAALNELLFKEIAKRNEYRDQYCEEHAIPSTDKLRIKKASSFVRSKSGSFIILFESLGDLCRIERTPELEAADASFSEFFKRVSWYGIYFISCFYPEDEKGLTGSRLMQSFNPEQFCMLFGGRYDKQCLIPSLGIEYRRINTVSKEYDKCLMYYHENIYSMRMPCGEIIERQQDPDDEPIV